MTNNTAHANCDHEATKAARAACRKARNSKAAAHEALIQALFEAMPAEGDYKDWLLYGGSAFGGVHTSDRREAAEALLAYFAPSGDEDRDARRRANGYTVTTSASTIRSIILRRAS